MHSPSITYLLLELSVPLLLILFQEIQIGRKRLGNNHTSRGRILSHEQQVYSVDQKA